LTTKKLQQLKDAYESGLLTDEEFATKKKQVLDAAMIEDVPERGPLPQTTTPSPTPAPSPTEAPNTSQNVDDQSNHPPKKPQDGSKFIPIILILLFSLFVASGFLKEKKSAPPVENDAVEAGNGNINSESQQYVTASGLSLRATPNKGATRTNVLPSGTRILVKRTESQLVVDGQIGHWYRAVELEGYVAGHFIAPNMGVEGSPYVLERSSSGGELSHGNERLTLINGKVNLFVEHYWEGGNEPQVEEGKGTYKILPNGIHITMEPNHRQYSSIPADINLRYCKELGGFQTSNCAPPNQRMKANRKTCEWESPQADFEWSPGDAQYYSSVVGWWCPPKTNK
jgi:hypothetical protein